jgi:hypothetical protein
MQTLEEKNKEQLEVIKADLVAEIKRRIDTKTLLSNKTGFIGLGMKNKGGRVQWWNLKILENLNQFQIDYVTTDIFIRFTLPQSEFFNIKLNPTHHENAN